MDINARLLVHDIKKSMAIRGIDDGGRVQKFILEAFAVENVSS